VCRARPAPNSSRQPRGLGRRGRGLSSPRRSRVPAPAAPAGRRRCSGSAHVSLLAPRERLYYRSILWTDLRFAYPAFEFLKSRDDDVSDCQQRLHLGHRRRPPLLHAHGGGAQRQHRKHSSPSHDHMAVAERLPQFSVLTPSPFFFVQTKRTVEICAPYVALGLLYGYLLYLSWTPDTLRAMFSSKYWLPEVVLVLNNSLRDCCYYYRLQQQHCEQ
jgi:hypothetical protein